MQYETSLYPQPATAEDELASGESRSLAWRRQAAGGVLTVLALTSCSNPTEAPSSAPVEPGPVAVTIEPSSEPPAPKPQGANPIANPSLEQAAADTHRPQEWQADSWGEQQATFQYVIGDAHSGQRSAKLEVSDYQTGDAKWYFTPLTELKPGRQYVFSDWYKTNTQPHVIAQYTTKQGAEKYFNLPLPQPAEDAENEWQHYEDTFWVPKNAEDLTIFMLLKSNGWLQIDDYAVAPRPAAGFKRPMISLTFDDGWRSAYRYVLPALRKYDFDSTQYIISGKLNTPDYMTDAMVEELQREGSEIASHTVSHVDLTTLEEEAISEELNASQATLMDKFGGQAAENFASPYGTYDASVRETIEQYYRSERSTDAGFNDRAEFDPYNIRVQNIAADTTPAEVAGWVATAKATKTWLVLVYHKVSPDEAAADYSITPKKLRKEFAIIDSSGVPVVTVSQALDKIEAQQTKIDYASKS